MWLSMSAASKLWRETNGPEIAREVQIDIFHRHHLRVPTTRRPPFSPKTGPKLGSRRQMIAFLPILLSASPTPTVVVVLPSPAGVGHQCRYQNQLPSGLLSRLRI